MSVFHAVYPDYATTARLDDLRASEYGYLDASGHTYLDYTGAGLTADAQLRAHAERLREACFGNPHSDSPAYRSSARQVAQARQAVLDYFNADADEYAVIFTQNATGACRLVGEAYPFRPMSRLVLTADNHNSVNGLREFARARGAVVRYVGLSAADLTVPDDDVRAALGRGVTNIGRGLFAYPAQSNVSGVQHPLSWVGMAQAAGYDVLLDAAAFVPANRLDLSAVRPEFVALSWYKMFGYPAGVGCLLARRDALRRLVRPWFSGGTTSLATVCGGWHRLAAGEAAFEDGQLDHLSIPDVTAGLAWIGGIGIDVINRRVDCLTRWLLDNMACLMHGDGSPMVRVYGPRNGDGRGGTVAFSFLDPRGEVVDERIVDRDATAAGISLGTGAFCNPGVIEAAFGLTAPAGPAGLEPPGRTGHGVIRVSLGLASTVSDVQRFLDFAGETYRDAAPPSRACHLAHAR